MKRKFISIISGIFILGVMLTASSTMARAQSYSFDVEYMECDVYIETDGSITIEYLITFYCHFGAHEIDWVDIGFPNEHYDISSVEATINGKEISSSKIGESPYVTHGVEIGLGSDAIQPGERGTLYVKGNNPKMIYEDYEDTSLASMEFSPTWFDDDFCDEYEELVVNIHFPQDLSEEYGDVVKYHYDKYDEYSEDANGNLVYTWEDTNLPMKQHMYGVSFPKEYVDSFQPGTANPALISLVVSILLVLMIIALVVAITLLAIQYKRYQKRYYPPVTKKNPSSYFSVCFCVVFLGLMVTVIFSEDFLDTFIIFVFGAVFIGSFGVIGFFVYKAIDKRLMKLPYDKPNIKIDSVGANKHLSVVEAAIIQNTPLNKVIFLIMFPLIRSGHLEILGTEPLKFKVREPKDAKKLKVYQQKFLKAMLKTGPKEGSQISEAKLKKLLIDLIKATYKKMKGFDLDKTIRYYNTKIADAWKEIQDLPEEVEWDDIEKQYDWLILDDDFKPKSKKYLRDRYYYHSPYWYRRYYYYHHYYPMYYHGRYYSDRPKTTVPTEHINIHSFSDSIVRGIENISNSMVTGFSNFANSILQAVAPMPTGGSGSGSGRSGGGGCACACACAGCACACAGGGR